MNAMYKQRKNHDAPEHEADDAHEVHDAHDAHDAHDVRMVYCHACGAELSREADVCPVCGAAVPEELISKETVRSGYGLGSSKEYAEDETRRAAEDGGSQVEQKRAYWSSETAFNTIWRRRLAALILTISTWLPGILLLCIDWMSGEGGIMTWGIYPLVSLGLVWSVSMTVMFLRRSSTLAVLICWLLFSVFLRLIDNHAAGASWFQGIAFPILSLFFLAVLLTTIFVSQHKGWKAFLLFVGTEIVVFCIGIDAVVNSYLGMPRLITWSFIVLLVLGPVMIIFSVLGSRPKMIKRIKRILHI